MYVFINRHEMMNFVQLCAPMGQYFQYPAILATFWPFIALRMDRTYMFSQKGLNGWEPF